MRALNQFFENNKSWAKKISEEDPDFFAKLSKQQNPQYLWIGCSDSRVPANEIVGMMPGEIFVHRNIANVVCSTDINCLSVIQYAVEILKVKHIIICGHYECGGVKAAMDDTNYGLMDAWLTKIKDVYDAHKNKLDKIPNQEDKYHKLCELNVISQVYNLCTTDIIRKAWKRGQNFAVHGWIYSVSDGLLKDLKVCVTALNEIESVLRPHLKDD